MELLKSTSKSILKVLQSKHDDEQLANTSDDVAIAQVAAAQTADASADGANDRVETFFDLCPMMEPG